MRKLLITQLKGFGDFVICAYFLRRLDLKNYDISLICCNKHKELASLILPKKIKLIFVDNSYSNFFYLKKNLFTFFKTFWVRKIIKKEIQKGFNLVIFDLNIKFKILFLGISYLDCSRENIYNSYSLFFKLPILIKSKYNYKNKKILIFPFGDSKNRQFNKEKIKNLSSYNSKKKINKFRVIVHSSNLNLLCNMKQNIIIYKKFNQLVKEIKKSNLIVTTDTVCLHLALLFNKSFILITKTSKKYIPLPKYLKKNNCITNFKNANQIINRLLID